MAAALPRSLKTRNVSSFSQLKAPNLWLGKQIHGGAHGAGWWLPMWRLGQASAVGEMQKCRFLLPPEQGLVWVKALTCFHPPPNCHTAQKKSYRGVNGDEVRNSLLFCSSGFDMKNCDNANLGCLPTSVHCTGDAGIKFSGR